MVVASLGSRMLSLVHFGPVLNLGRNYVSRDELFKLRFFILICRSFLLMTGKIIYEMGAQIFSQELAMLVDPISAAQML